MTSFTLLLSKKLFLLPLKKKITSYFYSQKLLSEKLRDLPDAMPHIGHFVFYYLHVTYRKPYHASGHLAIYRECYGFERVFFTLRSFLPYTPSC